MFIHNRFAIDRFAWRFERRGGHIVQNPDPIVKGGRSFTFEYRLQRCRCSAGHASWHAYMGPLSWMENDQYGQNPWESTSRSSTACGGCSHHFAHSGTSRWQSNHYHTCKRFCKLSLSVISLITCDNQALLSINDYFGGRIRTIHYYSGASFNPLTIFTRQIDSVDELGSQVAQVMCELIGISLLSTASIVP